MKHLIPILLLVQFVGVGCGRRTETVSADPGNHSPREPGQVTLPPDKLREIRVEAVSMGDVPNDQVDAPGRIELNPNRVSRVLLPVTGRVASVLVKLGDSVSEGQPLVTVESPDADSAIAAYLQAEGGVRQAEANLVKTRADMERAVELFNKQAVAQKETLNAENAHTQALAAVEQAQALAGQALRRLEILGLRAGVFGQSITVRAPIAGKVLDLGVTTGEYRNDATSAIMTIADLSTVWVASDIPENMIRFIQAGERIEVQLAAFPEETFTARVTRIADTLDPQTRTVKVRAELANPGGRLRPEMYGSIRHVESTRRLPMAPNTAVVQRDGQTFVYLETSRGVFQPKAVAVGNRVGDRFAILNGIKAGDRVVADGAMLLKSF